ncbi:MAG: bleomycin resistance protein [Proteobacteria bacterium]|nr:bleomycin resistance protein [Pseudomonadota bacterium]
MNSIFHLSLPCLSVSKTTAFYKNDLGCEIGRSTENWVDVNLFGHQTTFTKAGKYNFNSPDYVFEGNILPSFHFGIIIKRQEWQKLFKKLSFTSIEIIDQTWFLKNKKGEHVSFFIKDPNGYTLEFKSFKNMDSIYSI